MDPRFVDGENQIPWGNAFIIKHSAELNESGFSILSRMVICEEAHYLIIIYLNVVSGLGEISGFIQNYFGNMFWRRSGFEKFHSRFVEDDR